MRLRLRRDEAERAARNWTEFRKALEAAEADGEFEIGRAHV